MNASQEHIEAFLLEQAQSRRLFGVGDYLLSQEQLLAIIDAAHIAGRMVQNEKLLRRFDELAKEETV